MSPELILSVFLVMRMPPMLSLRMSTFLAMLAVMVMMSFVSMM